MKFHQWHSIISMAVQHTGKFAVYINNGLTFEDEDTEIWNSVIERVKIKYPDTHLDVVSDLICGGLFLFDTEDEAWHFFDIFNSGCVYASAIFAMVYDSNGNGVTENT
jgi:hypothetical protein